jgi:undecaprenyl diphosphate synthase
MDIKQEIDIARLPRHIAIIMDGNGRWAKAKGQARVFGHRNGVKAVRECTEAGAELGIEYMTLYAFSTENWNRPKFEVDALMTLLVDTLAKEIATLNKNNIRLQAIGDLSQLPDRTRKALLEGIQNTSGNTRMTLVLALNYSGKWDIVEAARKLADRTKNGEITPEDINAELFAKELNTAGIPDPELLIRTSGESRLSNFLLWQLAYAEFCFLPIFWPDFRKENLYQAIYDYQQRERRFGLVSEQLS